MPEVTLQDFENDMQLRGDKSNYRVNGHYVIEKEWHRSPHGEDSYTITLWKPQEENGKYVREKGSDNKFHWIAVGRKKFYDSDYEDAAENTTARDEASTMMAYLSQSRGAIKDFEQGYDYDGPRKRIQDYVYVDSAEV